MNQVIKRNLQNEILTLLLNEHKPAEFHFMGASGIMTLRGVVLSFDEFRIEIESFGKQSSLYKRDISHISSLAGNNRMNLKENIRNNTNKTGYIHKNTRTEIRTWHSS